tara:strand:+ start:435 stop:1391 length:957 start_codon:yes stop_codon:yes gene_type:complete
LIKFIFYYFLLTIASFEASSHEFTPAQLEITQISESDYLVNWKFPINQVSKSKIKFPEFCSSEEDLFPKRSGKYLQEIIELNCSESLKGSTLNVSNMSFMTDVMVTIRFVNDEIFQDYITSENSDLVIPSEVEYSNFSYLFMGFEHLLGGYDHILFVFGLVFLISGWFNLIKTITSFTLAHSITLALSSIGVIRLPQIATEAVIALTIIYLAYEILDKKDLRKIPWHIPFGFGLIHGFGFAGALMEIGFSGQSLFQTLLLFNVGIELAQLSLLPIIFLLIFFFTKMNLRNEFKTVSAFSIGGISSYWFLERTLNLFYA